jgi:4-amino-4-deoxy-L-arabinose transferase-like glycosyltransferase
LPHFLLLALVAGSLFFSRPDLPLLEPEEARYAEIPRQMLGEGRLMVPVLHGRPYWDKPPLLYWLVMGCYCLLGPHDWASRLVPGAAGTLTVLLVYGWGRRALGTRGALLAALVLCLSPRFVYLARTLSTDGLLALAVTAALLAARRAVAGRRLRWRWWLVSAGAVGAGLLAKGPVALALAAPPVLAFCRGRAGCRPSARAWLAYLAAAGAVAGPWYVALAVTDPSAAADFFWRHHLVRFARPFDHAKPAWFYLPGLLGGLLPWLLIAPAAWLWARRHRPVRVRGAGLFLLAGLWCFLFFSASGCKRAIYILPALPPLALALGRCLDAALPRRPGGGVRLAWGAGGLAALAGVLGWVWLVLPAHHRAFSLRDQVRGAGAAADEPVLCYPRRWDSVSFYLGRDDIRAYEAGRLGELLADLRAGAGALVFVKDGAPLDGLRRALPAGLDLSPSRAAAGVVVAARVRRRQGGS